MRYKGYLLQLKANGIRTDRFWIWRFGMAIYGFLRSVRLIDERGWMNYWMDVLSFWAGDYGTIRQAVRRTHDHRKEAAELIAYYKATGSWDMPNQS